MDTSKDEEFATPEEVQRARDEYQTNDIEIDEIAKVSRGADGGFWVAAWVWLSDKEDEEEDDSSD